MQNGHSKPWLGFWLKLLGIGAASAFVAAPLEASRGAFSAEPALPVPPAAQAPALAYPRMPAEMEARLAEALDPTPAPMMRAPGELFTDRAGLGEPGRVSGGASVAARPSRAGMPRVGGAADFGLAQTAPTAPEDTFETRLAARREALERGRTAAPMSTPIPGEPAAQPIRTPTPMQRTRTLRSRPPAPAGSKDDGEAACISAARIPEVAPSL